MNSTAREILEFVREEDVKFVRLAFCDVFGRQKNIAIMAGELERAFSSGIAVDASAVAGFGGGVHSDLFLHPDPMTLSLLPWRPENGRAVRMFCQIKKPDGSVFENDLRSLLARTVAKAEAKGVRFSFGAEMEFYLFRLDEKGEPTRIPVDDAGYMDVAPHDRGENVRREICLNLEQLGIRPESSHHEEGPGQNEIDFRYSAPLSAADNAVTFRGVVESVVAQNGLHACFSPKPLPDQAGSGLHVNISVKGEGENEWMEYMIAGILYRVREMTRFLDPTEESYLRLGNSKAPRYVTWSSENRSQLIRIPAATGEFRRVELRSPDPGANPYLAFALLIEAGLEGILEKKKLPAPTDLNLFTADPEEVARLEKLPETLAEASALARESDFIRRILPQSLIDTYCN